MSISHDEVPVDPSIIPCLLDYEVLHFKNGIDNG